MVKTERSPKTQKTSATASKQENPFASAPARSSANEQTDADKPYSRSRDNWEAVPGNALLRAIREEQQARGENTDDALREGLGLTPSGWNNIVNGSRDIRTLASRPGQLKWLANYLGIPAIAVRVMAGEMAIDELQIDVSLDDRLRLTAETLRKDPIWAMYAPHNIKKDWDTLPLNIRMLIKALYDCEQERTYNWAVEQAGMKDPLERKRPSKATSKHPPVVDDI